MHALHQALAPHSLLSITAGLEAPEYHWDGLDQAHISKPLHGTNWPVGRVLPGVISQPCSPETSRTFVFIPAVAFTLQGLGGSVFSAE